jgi:hypothetical protein
LIDVESVQITSRLRADQSRDLRADALREVDPARIVPRADQPFAPLAFDDFAHARRRCARQRTERIAVEVDDAGRQHERAPMDRERITAVELDAIVARHASSRSTARTGLASQPLIRNGSAIA